MSDFYAHPMMKDGHLNKCKECTKKYVAKYQRDNIEKMRRWRERYRRKSGQISRVTWLEATHVPLEQQRDRANTQLAHRSCNSSKGNRVF